MKDSIKKSIFAFFDAHYDSAAPVLLALSGGPDSLCLFDLMLAYQEKKTFSFGVAHVDHGWRKESADEAARLEKLCSDSGIPFHMAKTSPEQTSGNLENGCRTYRLNFFKALSANFGYQAVVLGHHLNDQAETVLKRIFEGASIAKCGAMSVESVFEGLRLWRPLLKHSKKDILKWIEKRGLHPFNDSTNADPKFLRGRFRVDVLPYLNGAFGKEIEKNLGIFADEAKEIRCFFEGRLSKYLKQVKKEPFGASLDLSKEHPETLLELKYLVKAFASSEGVFLSREQAALAAEKISDGKSVCQIAKNFSVRKKQLVAIRGLRESSKRANDFKVLFADRCNRKPQAFLQDFKPV